MVAAPEVDVVAGLETDVRDRFAATGPFGRGLVLNLLEHTFHPVKVLDAALSVAQPCGTGMDLTPAARPLPIYPFDSFRLLPKIYGEYAKRRWLTLDQETVPICRRRAVRGHQTGSEYILPRSHTSATQDWISRVVQRLLNTADRGALYKCYMPSGRSS